MPRMQPQVLTQRHHYRLLTAHVDSGLICYRIEHTLFESMDLEKMRSETQIDRSRANLSLVKERRYHQTVLDRLSAECSHRS